MSGHNVNPAADPLEQVAAACEMRMTVEPLFHAPYDVFEPPSEADDAYLVTLQARSGTEAASLRVVFLASMEDASGPTVAAVLWWLAGEAWTIDHAQRDLATWAAYYGFDLNTPATQTRFDRRLQLADGVRTLFGSEGYTRLLDAYRAQVVPAQTPADERGRPAKVLPPDSPQQ